MTTDFGSSVNMMRRSLDQKAEHVSPIGSGEIHEAYDGLKVRLLQAPERDLFNKLVYKAVMASRGAHWSDEEVDPVVVEDAFAGGLNQSLEWVNVTFEVSGVSRGVTHELVRTRQGGFAQQTFRHTDMADADFRMPEDIANASKQIKLEWKRSIWRSQETYRMLAQEDVAYQDARTVLPIATETYIVCNYPLKVFMDTFAYRGCFMFYPEIVRLFHMMRAELLEACPWLQPFVLISCEKTRPNGEFEHQCTFQGWEKVEGQCPFPWAKENNRVWKSKKFDA